MRTVPYVAITLALVALALEARAQVSPGSVRVTNSAGTLAAGVTAHAATGGNGLHVFGVQNAPASLSAGQVGFAAADTSARAIIVGAGVAGTPAGGVLSVQGTAGGTAMPVSGTITATVASVGATGSAVPASASYAGYLDSTGALQGARLFDGDSGAGSQWIQGANLRISASGGSLEAAAGTGTRSANVLRVTIATDDVVPVSQSGTWNIGTVTAVTAITNTVTNQQVGNAALGQFATTCASTATQLASNSAKRVTVRVDGSAAEAVYLGTSTVTSSGGTRGVPLYAGDAATFLLTNTNALYCIVGSVSQTLYTTFEN